MANSRQSATIFSPSSKRPTKRTRSSITEHSFQGIASSPRGGSVTYVRLHDFERRERARRSALNVTVEPRQEFRHLCSTWTRDRLGTRNCGSTPTGHSTGGERGSAPVVQYA